MQINQLEYDEEKKVSIILTSVFHNGFIEQTAEVFRQKISEGISWHLLHMNLKIIMKRQISVFMYI